MVLLFVADTHRFSSFFTQKVLPNLFSFSVLLKALIPLFTLNHYMLLHINFKKKRKSFANFIYLFIYLKGTLLIYLFIYLFIYGCVGSSLLRVLSLVRWAGATLHCSAWASHSSGFSCCRAWALGTQASVVVARGLSSCGSQALECRLSSWGAWV